jgi:hypothetical protein
MNCHAVGLLFQLLSNIYIYWLHGVLRCLKQNYKISNFFGEGVDFLYTFFLLDGAGSRLRRNPPMGAETRFLNYTVT